MDVSIEPVAYEHKAVLRRMIQLYLYDFSEFETLELNGHGEFDYRYLDHYWAPEPGESRYPFFIQAGGRRVGFALVRALNGVNVVSEFFVMRGHRRGGIGTAAAKLLFSRLPGEWLVHQVPANLPAQAFWRGVIAAVTRGDYTEAIDADGVTQRFRTG